MRTSAFIAISLAVLRLAYSSALAQKGGTSVTIQYGKVTGLVKWT